MELKFCARILQNENMDAAYVEVPYDIKELFGKGRLLVNAILDNNLDLSKLMAVSLYIEELASKKNYLHVHLYVQRCFGDSRSGGELDGFYAASLHEEVLKGYALYFTLYLRKIVSEINEARKKIREYQGLMDLMAQEKPVEYVPIN